MPGLNYLQAHLNIAFLRYNNKISMQARHLLMKYMRTNPIPDNRTRSSFSPIKRSEKFTVSKILQILLIIISFQARSYLFCVTSIGKTEVCKFFWFKPTKNREIEEASLIKSPPRKKNKLTSMCRSASAFKSLKLVRIVKVLLQKNLLTPYTCSQPILKLKSVLTSFTLKIVIQFFYQKLGL